MLYVDTSVLIALFTHEAKTQTVQAWYAGLGDTPLCSAAWCVTEFASALSIKQRTRQTTGRQAGQAWRQFEILCDGDLRLLAVGRESFRSAAMLALDPATGLRAGDALHLAVALAAGATGIASLDAALSANAKRLGLQPVPIN